MENMRKLLERGFIGGIVFAAVFAGFAGFLYLLYRLIKFMRPKEVRQAEQRIISQSMMGNMYGELKRLLPGFLIYENAEYIGISHPNDTAVELEVKIKKNGSSYYLFAGHRGSTMFFTSVSNSNEATVGAYFLVDKHLRCYPKPDSRYIRKAVSYHHKELSKKMRCPPSLEAIQDLYMQIWELI